MVRKHSLCCVVFCVCVCGGRREDGGIWGVRRNWCNTIIHSRLMRARGQHRGRSKGGLMCQASWAAIYNRYIRLSWDRDPEYVRYVRTLKVMHELRYRRVSSEAPFCLTLGVLYFILGKEGVAGGEGGGKALLCTSTMYIAQRNKL